MKWWAVSATVRDSYISFSCLVQAESETEAVELVRDWALQARAWAPEAGTKIEITGGAAVLAELPKWTGA